MVVGVLTAFVGMGGFVDTRKVDRRYKTGYKNNEPDTRDFGRAGKVLLYGIGICIIGAAVNSVFDSNERVSPTATVESQSAVAPEPVLAASSDANMSSTAGVKLDSGAAQISQQSPNALASNEIISNSSAVSADEGKPAQLPQNGSVADAGAMAGGRSQTFLTSFDCRRATHDDEVAICGDAGLAAMDRQLSQLYAASMRTISDPQALKRSESDWVLARRMCDKDVDCLRRSYGERIGQFLGSMGSKPLLAIDSQTEKQ
ncbi:lysozyme inhibitor LprI family protein [Burkholderia ambifaria]|uniref:lysozyme inhibitor LprI family protein n=1 Tax=Burkholderia ambifaria TaxID=152480 RepID=UPI001E3CA946|nr:hypothetical protein [Burkholderia ambifaria]UEP20257.1 hypothetical protein LL999_09735 [Burkholderia ambifaria]WDR90987.1 hypothetical protein OR986_19560 [Burkholderia ambifaria]WDS03893.1 hypothetical protein OR985_24560 [Burkholderia ambifaria]